MAHVQFTDVQERPTEFLDLTSLTRDEFQQLVLPFEAAFQAHMAAWRLDGKPRTARRFSVYQNCPLPTPEDRLLFILAYVKTYSLQVVQGRLFGMGQSKANQWIHVLLPVLLAALRALGDAPARSLMALAQRLGGAEADAAAVVEAREAAPAPVATPEAPLVPRTGPHGASSAPKPLLHRKRVRAVRQETIRSKTSCEGMRCFFSSFSVTPMAAAPRRSPVWTRRRLPCRRGAGSYRLSASSPARCPRWRFSCRPRHPAVRRSPWRSNVPTKPSTLVAYGLST